MSDLVTLTRAVRFCINDAGADARAAAAGEASRNTYAGAPPMRGLGRYYELVVSCTGRLDPETGYFVNIKAIDDVVRGVAVPHVRAACLERPDEDPRQVLREIAGPVRRAVWEMVGGRGYVSRIGWALTPHYRVEVRAGDPRSEPMDRVEEPAITQAFEFAASHRLHNPRMTDAENRAAFGRCSHPSGHGHNYRIEVTARGVGLEALERVVEERVLERFDHKHLNVDEPGLFDPGSGGVNPSVENIARVCHGLLERALGSLGEGAGLVRVRVWETEKTSCAYPAE